MTRAANFWRDGRKEKEEEEEEDRQTEGGREEKARRKEPLISFTWEIHWGLSGLLQCSGGHME